METRLICLSRDTPEFGKKIGLGDFFHPLDERDCVN
jgi:hypothetical protein